MKAIPILRAAACVAALILAPVGALAQDAISAPAQKTIGAPKARMAPSLVVMNARAATLGDGKLTLTGVLPNTILFADRPVRAAGHAPTARLLEEWSANHSFAKDPPNATVSVLSKDSSGVADAVVVLERPKLEGDTLTFDVRVLEGSLAGADGPASLFIDTVTFPLLSLLANGGQRSAADDAAWYRANGDYAQPTPSDQLGPAFMNNGMDTTPWQQ